MSKTIKLADVSESSLHWSPKQMLEKILEDFESGETKEPNKAIVILCNFHNNSDANDDEIFLDGYYAGTNDLEANGILSILQTLRAHRIVQDVF